ncbi:MAG: hypothetical protein ACREV2_03920 [Burkholderiales bacterium]
MQPVIDTVEQNLPETPLLEELPVKANEAQQTENQIQTALPAPVRGQGASSSANREPAAAAFIQLLQSGGRNEGAGGGGKQAQARAIERPLFQRAETDGSSVERPLARVETAVTRIEHPLANTLTRIERPDVERPIERIVERPATGSPVVERPAKDRPVDRIARPIERLLKPERGNRR